MKAIAIVLVGLTLGLTMYISGAADQGSRPPGVLARDWIRINERLGFVVTQTDGGGRLTFDTNRQLLQASPETVGADLMPPLKGYFVIQTPTGWRQIVMSEPVATGQ
jgi:hypothetical protein